jgi:dihydrofolate reductase
MGSVVYGIGVSLDGYMEGPDHDISWHVVDDELHEYFNDEYRAAGVFVHGRGVWEAMSGAWPAIADDPAQPDVYRDFAAVWVAKPKLVYSRTLTEVGWNSELRREVDPDEIRALAASTDGQIAVGGADLAATFFAHDLIDEVRLCLTPVLLGAGTPAFPAAGDRKRWELVEHRVFGGGVVLVRYVRGTADTHA